jgi:beta-lactamase superfamily II metal-dependent hydrolase
MTTRYISTRTTYFYENATGSARHFVLIYGDEVDAHGTVGNRRRITFRGRDGFVNADRLMSDAPLEMYFLDVGQGDAAFIVTPGRRKILVDGGLNDRALGFLIWKYRLDQPGHRVTIDLLTLSHADGDHLNGLIPIITHPRITVREVVHNGIAIYRTGVHDTRLGDRDTSEDFLVTRHSGQSGLRLADLADTFADWIRAVRAEDCGYRSVDSTTAAIDVGDPSVTLEVLGPILDQQGGERRYAWWEDRAHTVNGHSVVLRLRYLDMSVLFSGDLNIPGSNHLLAADANTLSAHVLKSPHHGSHEFSYPFLEAVRPQVAVISSGDGPDHGHPRASFLSAIGRASRSEEPLLFSTEIAATFLDSGETLENLDVDQDLLELDFSTAAANSMAHRLFKLRLPGIINVRTDGHRLYAARRVAASYGWESYGPVAPAVHPGVF